MLIITNVVRIPFRRSVLDTALCDKVYQWLVAGRWFYLGTPVSSTMALNTITRIKNIMPCNCRAVSIKKKKRQTVPAANSRFTMAHQVNSSWPPTPYLLWWADKHLLRNNFLNSLCIIFTWFVMNWTRGVVHDFSGNERDGNKISDDWDQFCLSV